MTTMDRLVHPRNLVNDNVSVKNIVLVETSAYIL